jgi:hypothetical protein
MSSVIAGPTLEDTGPLERKKHSVGIHTPDLRGQENLNVRVYFSRMQQICLNFDKNM